MTSPLDPIHSDIRSRFAHVEACPLSGPRIFFENAGGALTLKSVAETSALYAAIPDNQGRANATAEALVETIRAAKAEISTFFGAEGGQVFAGESGTELLFRLIRTAVMGQTGKAAVIGSSIEHPATRSAARIWAERAGLDYIEVPHDTATGTVSAEAYAAAMRDDVKVATVLHCSPVSGMQNDARGIIAAIRETAPDALVIVDGIQQASHGAIDVAGMGADGYVISPYKVFSRHGYGIAWASARLTAMPLESLLGGPEGNWELGTRDTGAYATMRDVVAYFDWLGGALSDAPDLRGRIKAAAKAIHAHEARLTEAMLKGTGNLPGLGDLPGVTIIGGIDNPARAGLVCFALDGHPAADIVEALNKAGIRTHTRKADHYSGNVLDPLGLASAVRVSMCHYNSIDEVRAFLSAMQDIAKR